MASCQAALYFGRSTSAADWGGGYTSAGKPLGMNTFDSPLFSTGTRTVMAITSSVVQDVFWILPTFLHSIAAASSAAAISGFNFYVFQKVVHPPGPGSEPGSGPALSRGGVPSRSARALSSAKGSRMGPHRSLGHCWKFNLGWGRFPPSLPEPRRHPPCSLETNRLS